VIRLRKIVNLFKSSLLLVLLVGSIYQTGELWIDQVADTQFLYSVLPQKGIEAIKEEKNVGNLLAPRALAIYVGNDKIDYTKITSGWVSFDGISEACIKVIKEVLTTGQSQGELIEIDQLWKKKHILLTLPKAYSGETITSNLKIAKPILGKIGKIKRIILVPASISDEQIHLYIEDYEHKRYEHFTLKKDNEQIKISNTSLYEKLLEVAKNHQVPYTSTLENQDLNYKEMIILPLPSEQFSYHSSLFWQIPYVEQGVFEGEALDAYISQFFPNPETVTRIDVQDEVRYSDGQIVVTYNKEGLIEYKRNEFITEGKIDLSIALEKAEKFIALDTKETGTEYKLEDYLIHDDQVTFYYSLSFNAFPVVLSSGVDTHYEMSYPIEITMNKEEVLAYKRVVRQIDEALPQDGILEVSYKVIRDEFVEEVGKPIEKMYLGYKWVCQEERLTLYWVIESETTTYFYDVSGLGQR